ncbi:MAG TPA: energy transducer TonB [Saprospiraceae bacterium]|nr:energy transducer TonB [Saprospiraceae bacterium]HQW26199.1 energy transducer TonB [Saprospiraceae bacterium]
MKPFVTASASGYNRVLLPLIVLSLSILFSCSTSKQGMENKSDYTRDDIQYKNKYDIAFELHEKPLRYWHHYVVSEIPGGYRVRVFHPEKLTLIEQKTYCTSALTMLHGPYKSFWDDGSIRSQGAYHKGNMHGSWLECEPGKGKSSCGPFKKNRKEGVWTHMDTTGLMEYVYCWEEGSRHGKYYEYDTLGHKINEGMYQGDTLVSMVHNRSLIKRPYLKSCQSEEETNLSDCTDARLHQLVMQDLKYPTQSRQLGIEGQAVVQWDVLPDGKATNFRVPRSLSDEIGKACLDAFPTGEEWLPATLDGKPVKYTMSLTINFSF